MADSIGRPLVRPGDPSDLAAVAALEKACFTDPWTPASLLSELVPDPLRLPLVAEVEGVLQGYLMAWRVADQLHILNIAVAPEARRHGLGTVLLNAVAEVAHREGLVECTLEVRRGNTGAIAFYERHGFAVTGVRPEYYADNGEDALIMACRLTDLIPGPGKSG